MGDLTLEFELKKEDIKTTILKKTPVPMMVMSKKCHLHGLSPKELVKKKEEQHEFGGYFILKGTERIIRLIIANKRNFPLAVTKDSWTKETNYTSKGIMVKCQRKDESVTMNILNYLNNGTLYYNFGNPYKQKVPVVLLLKCLMDVSDQEIYKKIINFSDTKFTHERIELCLKDLKEKFPDVIDREDHLKLLGEIFSRNKENNLEIGKSMIDKWLLVHLDNNEDKFNFIILMIQKLLRFVNGEILEDDQDSIVNQEVLTPGQTYIQVLRFSLERVMDIRKKGVTIPEISTIIQRSTIITDSLRRLLATGNVSTFTLSNAPRPELTQSSGYSIIADKLNFQRYIAHFRSIHRGAQFMESRIVSIRKLRQESWGFICPVHTPDGAPCGLLNHLAYQCNIVGEDQNTENLVETLKELGMMTQGNKDTIPVLLDGKWIGNVLTIKAEKFCKNLRHLRANEKIAKYIEITHFPKRENSLFPLIGIYSHKFRFMRPVKNLEAKKVEYIGSSEQLFMNISCIDEDYHKDVTHQEIHPKNILSYVANLTPFSDFNQSPRNVYQCQMAKQTMGTPLHSYPHRTDNKLYRLQTPQKPLTKTLLQEEMPFNDFPSGTNAIVAVISHTGYDMEDAMIINKSSFERGFGHGSIIKTKIIDLTIEYKEYEKENTFPIYFENRSSALIDHKKGSNAKHIPSLDLDGLPTIGTKLSYDTPIYCVFNSITKQFKVDTWKNDENGTIEGVKVIGKDKEEKIYKIQIVFRTARNPTIGDKFSSRHGQKGVLSILWPQIDMPFSDNGITPDVIINPHAFPSRMTIGMLMEILSSKSGALHGYSPDATPFQFDENNRAVDYFGEQLKKAGYNYYGNETMYCGTLGTQFKAEIFIGVCYYQRLRHMVYDKYQARSLGPVSRLTHQPVKGRKKGGGIRFGEMERDGLLSYGASFLIRDRLFQCSDEDLHTVCSKCGGLLVAYHRQSGFSNDWICQVCQTGKYLEKIRIPFVFKYLANELSSMNIHVKVELNEY